MGRLKVPAVLFDLALTPYQLRRSAPILGRHNLPVLTELLGLSKEEYLALDKDGITGNVPTSGEPVIPAPISQQFDKGLAAGWDQAYYEKLDIS